MLKITNPATAKIIAEIPVDDEASIKQKLNKAKAAQREWAQLPLAARRTTIGHFGELLSSQVERLASVLTSEMGKPITQAREEIATTAKRLGFFLSQTEAVIAPQTMPNKEVAEYLKWEPLGVIANISAWNYPYFVGSNVFVPALLTGNAVLYKPSEYATLTGIEITKLLHEAGVPSDIFSIIVGDGSAGNSLTQQDVNGIFFTGSYATGARIANTARQRMMRLQLELGGKDSAYVCDDTDVKFAAESLAIGAFDNTGQSCCSIERIYVHEKIAEMFLHHFLASVKEFKVGDPMQSSTFIGPLARQAQLQILKMQIDDAINKGARLLMGGSAVPGSGYFFAPTVLVDVNNAMRLMQEESFGPVIGIERVKSDPDALTRMQDTQYGLTASVFCNSLPRAESILRQLDVGTAYINCCDRVSPYLPWSGRKCSGMGATCSTEGIRAFVQPKAWHVVKH